MAVITNITPDAVTLVVSKTQAFALMTFLDLFNDPESAEMVAEALLVNRVPCSQRDALAHIEAVRSAISDRRFTLFPDMVDTPEHTCSSGCDTGVNMGFQHTGLVH